MSDELSQCQQPDCQGSYDDFGEGEQYCDECGFPPAVSANGAISSPATGLAGATTRGDGSTTGTAGSGRSQASRHSERSGSTSSARSSSRSSRRSVSGRLSRSTSGSGRTQSVSVRSSRRNSSSSSSRKRLGAGLVTIPEVPNPDPASAVMENPEVPERKRFCSNSDCASPVGRSRSGRQGRTEGFCTKCGQPYSFTPKLQPGDIVNGQYEIAGCLAHGGLGWIYLAIDLPLGRRWVVLKGLLDTSDQDAMAVAISERRFLSEIEHSSIVRVYNFVEYLDPRTGSLDGYIVMEYIGGKSLKEIANERLTPNGRRDPLPVEQACAYGIEALEALGYLHSRNLVYCDFKVDNAIQQNDQLKLIDMGAVRRMDDEESAIYGTIGYQAPEIAETGPSVASDLYTVARTLAVLTFDFQGYTNVFVDSLPPPESIEVFRRYESFYRFLVRATDPDPDQRFASAEEMAEQLTGVLREVVALKSGKPRPAVSTLFGPEVRVVDTELLAQGEGDTSRLGARRTRPPRTRLGRRLQRAGKSRTPASPQPLTSAQPSAIGSGQATPAVPAQSGQPAAPQANAAAVPQQPSAPPRPTASGDLATEEPYHYGQTPAHVRLPGELIAPAASTTPSHNGPTLIPLHVNTVALALPVPKIDMTDPNATFLAGLLGAAPQDVLTALKGAPTESIEVKLRQLRAQLEIAAEQASPRPDFEETLAELESQHSEDWRVVWYRGLVALLQGDRDTSAHAFDAVYDAFPGEPAPKLALGVCAEMLGQLDNAAEYYRLVWSSDPNYVSGAFSLARVRLAAGDRAGAVEALESVPETSSHYVSARVAAVRARIRERGADEQLLTDLYAAADQVEQLESQGLDAPRKERLATEVLGSALDWVLAGRHGAPPNPGPGQIRSVLGSPLEEEGLRLGLERSCRHLARLATDGTERIEWVERANRFRPRTWV